MDLTVLADDGVPLHVEIDGDGEPTLVFVNGFSTTLGYWRYQRAALADVGRLVFFDHRGHGASGRAPAHSATVAQVASDLERVIEATAPGPVVLAGHSMGGIAIPALAAHRPGLFGEKVIGVALLDTTPGRVGEVFLDLPHALTGRVVRGVQVAAPLLSRLVTVTDLVRRAADPLLPLTARLLAFDRRADRDSVRILYEMFRSFRSDTLFAFIADVAACDYYHALDTLGRAETLLITGEHDRLIPLRHKEEVTAAIPGARLEVIPDTGHMTLLESPDLVSACLRDLAERAMKRH